MGFIYWISNKERTKMYIGQTTGNPKTRIKSHFNKNNKSENDLLILDECKCFENIKYGYLEVHDSALNMLERHLIRKLKTYFPYGYNVHGFGGGAIKKKYTPGDELNNILSRRISRILLDMRNDIY